MWKEEKKCEVQQTHRYPTRICIEVLDLAIFEFSKLNWNDQFQKFPGFFPAFLMCRLNEFLRKLFSLGNLRYSNPKLPRETNLRSWPSAKITKLKFHLRLPKESFQEETSKASLSWSPTSCNENECPNLDSSRPFEMFSFYISCWGRCEITQPYVAC